MFWYSWFLAVMLISHLGSNEQTLHSLKQAGFKKRKKENKKKEKRKDTAIIRILKRKHKSTRPRNKEENFSNLFFQRLLNASIGKPPPGAINEVCALKMDQKKI